MGFCQPIVLQLFVDWWESWAMQLKRAVRDWGNCNWSDCMKLSIKHVRRVGRKYRMATAIFD